ncbi:MAG: hypothetical protein ABSE82_12115 [Nitrososphaerales archaeon]
MPRAQSHKEDDNDKAPKPATFIELESINDLARLTCALERAPLPTFASKVETGYRMSTQLDFFHGSPVFYYSLSREIKQYLGYRTTTTGEEISQVDVPSNSSLVYSPIIEIVKFPKLFEAAKEEQERDGPKFQSIQVKDLMSLVKVATYKIMFEEPPLPIFAFPTFSGSWRIGTFARIEDFEEASLFFFFEQDSKPSENFVGYSTAKALAYFTNRTDEHGNLFVKIIRLKFSHPLVDTN